jgi:hypothetical protein
MASDKRNFLLKVRAGTWAQDVFCKTRQMVNQSSEMGGPKNLDQCWEAIFEWQDWKGELS